jgi:colanic acid biosynthesis protein WcaH
MKQQKMFLPSEQFQSIIKSTPLISIDLIVRNKADEILLGLRTNRPAQGNWFVPGGRVLKDEPLDIAFERLIKTELNLQVQNATFRGIYQHFYNDNVFNESFSTHYIVMAYEIYIDGDLSSLPVIQHDDYQWFSEKSLLDNENVHKHTKWYFQTNKQADSFVQNL